MRIEIALDAPHYIISQNPSFTLRIVNPNRFDVKLSGFTLGYAEPKIQIAEPGKGFGSGYPGFLSGLCRRPVLIPGNSYIEHHRFLVDGFLSPDRGFRAAGLYRIRAKSTVRTAHVDGIDEAVGISWEYNVAEFFVEDGTIRDHAAMDFLQKAFHKYNAEITQGTGRPLNQFRYEVFGEFLRRFGDNAYTADLEFELAKTLRSVIDSRISSSWAQDQIPEILDTFEDVVIKCIDRGSPYADPFLEWNPPAGKYGVLEIVLKHERWDLLRRVSVGLDEKYPGDKAASLFRKLILVANTESVVAAEKVLEKLRIDFARSDYVKQGDRYLAKLHRRAE